MSWNLEATITGTSSLVEPFPVIPSLLAPWAVQGRVTTGWRQAAPTPCVLGGRRECETGRCRRVFEVPPVLISVGYWRRGARAGLLTDCGAWLGLDTAMAHSCGGGPRPGAWGLGQGHTSAGRPTDDHSSKPPGPRRMGTWSLGSGHLGAKGELWSHTHTSSDALGRASWGAEGQQGAMAAREPATVQALTPPATAVESASTRAKGWRAFQTGTAVQGPGQVCRGQGGCAGTDLQGKGGGQGQIQASPHRRAAQGAEFAFNSG